MAIASTPTATPTASTKTPASAQELPKERMVNKGTKIAAWLLTGLYVVVALVLLSRFGLGDGSGGNWERALTIFNAFSAIGFAAVGVLLGTTVQQVNVSNAQNQAVAAKTSEDRMAEQAKKLSDAAKKKLASTLGAAQAPAFWSGHIPGDPIDAELRDAIAGVNELLRQRSLRG